jgi:hypothetical protein
MAKALLGPLRKRAVKGKSADWVRADNKSTQDKKRSDDQSFQFSRGEENEHISNPSKPRVKHLPA